MGIIVSYAKIIFSSSHRQQLKLTKDRIALEQYIQKRERTLRGMVASQVTIRSLEAEIRRVLNDEENGQHAMKAVLTNLKGQLREAESNNNSMYNDYTSCVGFIEDITNEIKTNKVNPDYIPDPSDYILQNKRSKIKQKAKSIYSSETATKIAIEDNEVKNAKNKANKLVYQSMVNQQETKDESELSITDEMKIKYGMPKVPTHEISISSSSSSSLSSSFSVHDRVLSDVHEEQNRIARVKEEPLAKVHEEASGLTRILAAPVQILS